MSSLLQRVIPQLFQDLRSVQQNNVDPWRQPAGSFQRLTRRLRDALWRTTSQAGLIRPGFGAENAADRVRFLLDAQAPLEAFYEQLGDERSRSLLVELLRLSILGSRHVKLSVNEEGYWRLREQVNEFRVASNVGAVGAWSVDEFALRQPTGVVALHAQPAHVLNTFLLEQYAYAHSRPAIRAAAGDVVLDLGGGWGDTALYFAQLVGEYGRVVTFECTPPNVALLKENLERNPALARRVQIIERAAWHESDVELRFQFNGPGSQAAAGTSGTEVVTTLTVDDCVRRHGLTRVDLIKMDIEGAEGDALRGARETIRRFQPVLAIAAYHRRDDFIRLPEAIRAAGVAYDFYLDHFTIFDEETVLFARPAARKD